MLNSHLFGRNCFTGYSNNNLQIIQATTNTDLIELSSIV